MFRRRRNTDDFVEEIKSHLELEADELQSEGMSEEEARRKAKVEFGNVQAAQERFYLSGRIVWFDNLRRDIQFALRQLARKPGFACVAFLSLPSASAQASPSLPLSTPHCSSPCPTHNPTASCLSAKATPHGRAGRSRIPTSSIGRRSTNLSAHSISSPGAAIFCAQAQAPRR